MFEYLKNSISPNEFIFLQETHSSVDEEKLILFTEKLIRAV